MESKHDEHEVRKAWMGRAREQTLETLPAFLAELAAVEHDYGSIVVACGAAALAAATAMDRSPSGGITGFQAGAIGWEFLSAWHRWPTDGLGHRLVDFDDLLYPQYAERFRGISRSIWDRTVEKAKALLADEGRAHEKVRAHWRAVVDGVVPFGLTITERD